MFETKSFEGYADNQAEVMTRVMEWLNSFPAGAVQLVATSTATVQPMTSGLRVPFIVTVVARVA
jgi:hypothetical protein